MRDRARYGPALLFALGVAAVGAGMVESVGLAGVVLPVAVLAVVAGLVEAAAARRTGRRRWVGAWGPAVLGMAATVAVLVATGPQGPDSGVALSIVVAAFAVVVPVFALVVHAVAAVALRVRPAGAGPDA